MIPNKVFQIVAAGKPLVTRDGAGIRELLTPGPGLGLVAAGDAGALAEALRPTLEPRAIGARLVEILSQVAGVPDVPAPPAEPTRAIEAG